MTDPTEHDSTAPRPPRPARTPAVRPVDGREATEGPTVEWLARETSYAEPVVERVTGSDAAPEQQIHSWLAELMSSDSEE